MTRDSATDGLQALRQRLDEIDEHFLDVVRRRIECCAEIACHKKEFGIPMMQPHRIGIVQQRARDYAARTGLSADFLLRLYEMVIEEACRVEDLIIGQSPP